MESVGDKECPLKACCGKWGYCGLTDDFCVENKGGAPGTGCQSNCQLLSNFDNQGGGVPTRNVIGYYSIALEIFSLSVKLRLTWHVSLTQGHLTAYAMGYRTPSCPPSARTTSIRLRTVISSIPSQGIARRLGAHRDS